MLRGMYECARDSNLEGEALDSSSLSALQRRAADATTVKHNKDVRVDQPDWLAALLVDLPNAIAPFSESKVKRRRTKRGNT